MKITTEIQIINNKIIIEMPEKYQTQLETYIKNSKTKIFNIDIKKDNGNKTLKQNSIAWVLMEIIAIENIGKKILGQELIRERWKIYLNLLETYAERFIIKTKNKITLEQIKKTNRVRRIQEKNNNYYVECYKSFSMLNKEEMSYYVSVLFDIIAEMDIGVIAPIDIIFWRQKWAELINREKIINRKTIEEIERSNHCEACFKPFYNDKEKAHIKARGMGGNENAEKNNPDNILTLCHRCHIEIWHKLGEQVFIQNFPHLKYQINKMKKK